MEQEYIDDVAYRATLLHRMFQFIAEGIVCDVKLVSTDGHEFSAHRSILAASSDYFKALFTTDMLEKESRSVSVDIEPSIMEDLLMFMYTGKVTLTRTNAKQLFLAADYLIIHLLKEKTAQFLTNRLSPETCFEMRDFAERYNCENLKENSDRFVEENFVVVAKSREFKALAYEQVEQIISNDNIIVDREEAVYEAMLDWVHADLHNRKQFFEGLFSKIRLFSMAKQYIRANVESEPLVINSLACTNLLLQGLKAFVFQDEAVGVLQPRKCLRKELTAAVMTGGLSGGRALKDTLAYVPELKQCVELQEMKYEREEHAVVVCNGFLYAIGGMNRPYSVDRYEPRTNTWCVVANLIEKAIGPAAVCLDEKLYVLGGKDGFSTISTVQAYEPATNQWTVLAPLNRRRKALCAAGLRGEIYAIGGCTYDNDSLDTVEKLKPSQHGATWQHVQSLRQHRKYACAEVLAASKIVVIGGYQDTNPTALRSCEVYIPESDEWQRMTQLLQPRAAAGIARVTNRLYVLGGRSDRRSTDSVEYYDVEQDQWQMADVKLPHGCAWFQCGVVLIPKNLLHAPKSDQLG